MLYTNGLPKHECHVRNSAVYPAAHTQHHSNVIPHA